MDCSSSFVSNYDAPVIPMREHHRSQVLSRFIPPSLSQSEVPMHLSTYTPGEDFGRLAKLAKEFGLARIRNQKKQIRHGIPRLAVCDDNQQQQFYDRQTALRYQFSGYSIWLELKQEVDEHGVGDLDFAVKKAANEFRLGGAIPAPHVTALYGITTIATDEEAIAIFRKDVLDVITNNRAEKRPQENNHLSRKLWPDLDATGILVGAEFEGVDGGEMDMAWAEITFATSPEHESLINDLYDIFYCTDSSRIIASNGSNEEMKPEYPPRSRPWVPHLSICYDNPEGFGSSLTQQLFEDFLRAKCPTLAPATNSSDATVKLTRVVNGISLWKTSGTMAEWKCLDRFEFGCA